MLAPEGCPIVSHLLFPPWIILRGVPHSSPLLKQDDLQIVIGDDETKG